MIIHNEWCKESRYEQINMSNIMLNFELIRVNSTKIQAQSNDHITFQNCLKWIDCDDLSLNWRQEAGMLLSVKF